MISWQNLLALEGSNYFSLHFACESARAGILPSRLVRHSSLIDDGDDHCRERLLFSYSAKVHFPIALRSEPGRQMYVIRETTMRAYSLARSLIPCRARPPNILLRQSRRNIACTHLGGGPPR